MADKATAEAAMAVGETSGQVKPRQVVSSSARRPQTTDEPVLEVPGTEGQPGTEQPAPLVKEADPELERLLAEEEEIERSTRETSETPHFRSGDE
jgi:small subunit ribosomal protein S3